MGKNISGRAIRLKKMREFYGLTQAQMGDRLGVPAHNIRDAEAGKQKISLKLALKIEEKFSVRPRWIENGEDPVFTDGTSPPALQVRQDAGTQCEPSPFVSPDFYQIVEELSGRVTIVTQDQMQQIHKLLRILNSKDLGIVEAIKANLREFERMSGLLNTRFADMIILERRVKQLPPEQWPEGVTQDRRKAPG
jgi:DNA-binding XRE family transcriptional regulator